MSLLIIRIDTPSRARLAQQPVDFRLGADVDAARRLVDDQHFRPEREPFRQHHLLLVAAAQGRGPDLDRRRFDLQLLADRRDRLTLLRAPTRARAVEYRPSAGSDTFSRIEKSTTRPGDAAVLGHEEDPVPDRVLRGRDPQRLVRRG